MSSLPVPVDGSDERRAPVKQELTSAEDDARRIPEPDVVELKPAVDDLRTKERDLQQSLRNLRQQNRAQEAELVDLRKEVEQLRKKQADQQPHADPALPSEPLESSASNGAENTPNRKTPAARKPGTVVKSFGAAQLAQAQAEKQQAIERLKEAEQQLRQLQLESNADKLRIPTLQAKISKLTTTNEQAVTEKDALSRELRRLQQRYTDADQRSGTTQAELAQLRQEHGLTQQELLRQCARTSRIEDKEKDLQSEVQRLQSDLLRAPTPAELVQLRQEHQRTQQELEGERQRANLLDGENKRLQNEVERLQSELLRAHTPGELVHLRKEHERTHLELERERQKATRLDGENKSLQNEVEQLESELRRVNEERTVRAKRKHKLTAAKALIIERKKRFARSDDDDGSAQVVNGDPAAFVEDLADGSYRCLYPDINSVPCGDAFVRRYDILTHVRGLHFRERIACARCEHFCRYTGLHRHMLMHELHDADAEAKRRAMERPERLTRRQAREAEDRAAAEGAQDKDHDGQEEQDV